MSDLVSFGGVDGAVMLDPDGQCHAFGVILDGRAEGRGDPARGSRFNSAIRYQRTMARKSLLVVISDDGTMDLIPNLMPQVHKSEVEAAVDDCRATCSEDIVDGERFALTHERVRKLAFYLKAPSLYSGFGLALLAKAPLGVGSWGAEALATRVAERWAGVRVGIHFLKPYSAIRFMKVAAPSLAPILRSDAQGRILACVLADPDKSHSLSDLVAATGTSMPTVLREVRRGEQAAILTTEKVGPMRQVRARVDHPLYGAVRRIILATYGPPTVVAEEFAHIQGAEAVLLIGSWAARYLGEAGRAPNDVDVLVIGDADRDLVDDAAQRVEERIGMPVQATVRTHSQWRSERGSFIREVKSRPLVVVLANDEQEPTRELLEHEAKGR